MKKIILLLMVGLSYNSIGQDTTSIIIGDLEVMTKDLGKMNFEEAQKACKELGDGWRLPTKKEFTILCENKDKIGGFETSWYWSSTELNGQAAWIRYIKNCDEMLNQKLVSFNVRPIKTRSK